MGNYVCTDAVPFSLDDIADTQRLWSHLQVVREGELLSRKTLQGFEGIDHNLKAFAFHYNGEPSAAPSPVPEGSGSGRGEVRRSGPRVAPALASSPTPVQTAADPLATSRVIAESISLSKSVVRLQPTKAYLLVHLQCLPPSGSGDRTPHNGHRQRDEDAARFGGDRAPTWAREMTELFTPRGIAVAFAGDIGRPTSIPPQTPRSETVNGVTAVQNEYRFSIHLLTGKQAHPLVSAVAVLHALQLEKRLTESPELVRRLFHNCNVARLAGPALLSSLRNGREDDLQQGRTRRPASFAATLAQPTPIGRIILDGDDGALLHHATSTSASTRLQDIYMRNSLLRILHSVRLSSSPRPALGPGASGHNSARYSHSSTPRSATTPRSARVPTTSATPGTFLLPPRSNLSVLTTAASATALQGPPVLEVPPLRINVASAFATTPRTRGTATPPPSTATSLRTGASSTQRDGVSPRLRGPVEVPTSSNLAPPSLRLPNISSLPIGTAANGPNAWHNLSSHSGGHMTVRDEETDEKKVAEERSMRLRRAAPEASEVLTWLFVGGIEAAMDRPQLLEKGITAVVNTVAMTVPNAYPDVFRYLSLNLTDIADEPIFALFPVVNEFIEKVLAENGKVYVHCHQGVSRSCSFVIAYVMWKMGLCYDRAYELVRARRNVCNPNAGFYVNLHLWQTQLSRPVLNKAYAYTPYTADCLMPFSFRTEVAFRWRSGSYSDDRAAAIHGVIPVAMDTASRQANCALDSRLCYGFLFGKGSGDAEEEATAAVGGARAIVAAASTRPATLRSFLFAGPDADAMVVHRARSHWASFLRHNFYNGAPTTSVDDGGRSIAYSPLPPLAHDDGRDAPSTAENLAARIEESMREVTSSQRGASPPTIASLKLTLARGSRWDELLRKSDLMSTFETYQKSEYQTEGLSATRKRLRESARQELRGQAGPHLRGRPSASSPMAPTAPAVPLTGTQSPRLGMEVRRAPDSGARRHADSSAYGSPRDQQRYHNGAESVREPVAAPASAGLPPGFSLRMETNALFTSTSYSAAAQPVAASALPAPAPGADTESGPPLGDIVVLRYPFGGAPLEDIVSLSDLDTSQCYAIIIPKTESNENNVFLWRGEGCDLPESLVMDAYQAALVQPSSSARSAARVGKPHSVKLHGGFTLHNTVVSIVQEGNEPDLLFLVLE